MPKVFEPEWVAQQLVQALRGNAAQVVPGGNGMLLLVQRIAPPLAARIMNRIGRNAVAKALLAADAGAKL